MYAPQTGRAWSGKFKIGKNTPARFLDFSDFQKYKTNASTIAE
jgi:hypothetical protein